MSGDEVEDTANQILKAIREQLKSLPLHVISKINLIVAEQMYKKSKEVCNGGYNSKKRD